MNDDFEQQLQRQSPRPLPSDWRANILRTARASSSPRPSTLDSRPSWLFSLLWPHPRAWAALATAWAIILVLNFSARDDSPRIAKTNPAPPSAEMLIALRQQKLLLAELIGSHELPAAEQPRKFPALPHSQRSVEILNA